MSIRKYAAQAALLLSLFLAAALVLWFFVIPGMGMQPEDWNNPAKSAQFMIDHTSVFTLAYFFDWVFGVTTFLLAMAYTQKFSRTHPWMGVMIGGTGVISSALFFLAGTIGVYGTKMAALDYAANHSLATAITTQQIQFYISSSAVAIVGVLTYCAARASSKSHVFANWTNICGYISGICYTGSIVLGAINMNAGMMIQALGLITGILFNLGVAMSFMKQEHPELTLNPAS
jgi:hypothetical protein